MTEPTEPKAEVKLEAPKQKPEITLAAKLHHDLPFAVEKYKSLLKGTTKSGLLTTSMIYAYQKGIQDAIKLLLKGDSEKSIQKES